MTCTDQSFGMFCTAWQKWGKLLPGARGGWTTRGTVNRNHAAKLFEEHASSIHRGTVCESATTAAIAQQVERNGQNVVDLQCTCAAREIAERKQRKREVIQNFCGLLNFLS